MCYKSKRWEKWISKDFVPKENKEELIKICGHYVMSQKEFLNQVKYKFPKIDEKIKNNIKIKLNSLHGL